jgi:hypothetical protein
MQAVFKEAENGQLQQVKKILSAYPTAVSAKTIKVTSCIEVQLTIALLLRIFK